MRLITLMPAGSNPAPANWKQLGLFNMKQAIALIGDYINSAKCAYRLDRQVFGWGRFGAFRRCLFPWKEKKCLPRGVTYEEWHASKV